MLKLISEQVDIYQMPKADHSLLDKGGEITIGDLHGNAIKLLFMLFKHGIASGIDKADYDMLVAIYKMPHDTLIRSDLELFNTLLSKIRFNTALGIRLIGDELADRGSNDYFTLKLLEQLHKHQVPFEINVSNHVIEFIEAYETNKEFNPSLLHYAHVCSLVHLNALITKNLVAREEIALIIKNVYQPHLKALAYSFNEAKTEITIYSHAGIGLNNLKALAEQFEITYLDASIEELASTIDGINTLFQSHIYTNSIHTLYTRADLLLGYGGKKVSHAPFVFLIWNRLYKEIERPQTQYGYTLNYVHGHDPNEPNQPAIFNLDNMLGKFEGLNQGEYTALYSSTSQMPYVNPFSPSELRFNSALESIRVKAGDLKRQGHVKAADTALTLYNTVSNAFDELRQTKHAEHFKQTFLKAMEIARPELEQRRGWKQLLSNLDLFYGTAIVMNYAVNERLVFFRTDSARKMDRLEGGLRV